MLKEAGLGDRQPRLTFYSLRHFYATLRILKGVPIYDLSLTMGCSVNHIESHYSHIKTSQVAGRITRSRSDDLEVRTSIPDFGRLSPMESGKKIPPGELVGLPVDPMPL